MRIKRNILTATVIAQIGTELPGSHGKNGGIVSDRVHVSPSTNLKSNFL